MTVITCTCTCIDVTIYNLHMHTTLKHVCTYTVPVACTGITCLTVVQTCLTAVCVYMIRTLVTSPSYNHVSIHTCTHAHIHMHTHTHSNFEFVERKPSVIISLRVISQEQDKGNPFLSSSCQPVSGYPELYPSISKHSLFPHHTQLFT